MSPVIVYAISDMETSGSATIGTDNAITMLLLMLLAVAMYALVKC